MKVCKFGGTSMADAKQISKVMDIVLADPARRMVVVSAPGKRNKGDTKVTDLLIALAETALEKKDTSKQLKAVLDRYASIAEDLDLGVEIVEEIHKDLKSRLASSKKDPGVFMDTLKAAGEDNNITVDLNFLTFRYNSNALYLPIRNNKIINSRIKSDLTTQTNNIFSHIIKNTS